MTANKSKMPNSEQERLERDAWDEILQTPQSIATLNTMSQEALEELASDENLQELDEL